MQRILSLLTRLVSAFSMLLTEYCPVRVMRTELIMLPLTYGNSISRRYKSSLLSKPLTSIIYILCDYKHLFFYPNVPKFCKDTIINSILEILIMCSWLMKVSLLFTYLNVFQFIEYMIQLRMNFNYVYLLHVS